MSATLTPHMETLVRIARAAGDFFKSRESGTKSGKRRLIPANLVLRQSA